jgi:F-type H+-transporting ATPase subunit alpha
MPTRRFLESDLFNAGIRPAINVGLSVSRVGSSAQTKAMKSVVKSLKNDLAQYRALAAFAQFESDLDEETKRFIDRGARMTQLLKQGKNMPYDLASQVAIFWVGGKGYLDTMPADNIVDFEKQFLDYMRLSHKKVLQEVQKTRVVSEETEKALKKAADAFMSTYKAD